MKRWILGLLLFVACGSLQAAESAGDIDYLAKYIKENGRFVSRLDGDVTGDSFPDTILVMANDDRFEATVTVFMRFRGDPVTGKIGDYQGADSLTVELSPYGPPTVRILKGVLIIDHLFGGTTVRTKATYRYRVDAMEGRMRLIGLDAERTSPEMGAKLSWNVLTGLHIFQRGNRDPQGQAYLYGKETRTTSKQPPIYMSLTPNPEDLLDRALGFKK